MNCRLCWVLVLLLFVASRARSQFRTPEWQNFHNSTFYGTEPEAARAEMFAANEQFQAEQYEECGRTLLRLLQSRVEGRVRYGDRLVLEVAQAVALTLARLPAGVRAKLAEQEERAATELWSLIRHRDRHRLLELATGFPLNQAGAKGSYFLGLQQLLRGDPDAAASYFEELVHWPSAIPGPVKALASARLIQGLQRMGQQPGSSPLFDWPEATVLLRGKPVSSTVLTEQLGPFPDVDSAEWPTLGGSPARANVSPGFSAELHAAKVLSLFDTIQTPEMATHRLRFRVDPTLYDTILPTHLPVVAGKRLISIEEDGIHVRDHRSGQDLFPPLTYDFDFHIDPKRFAVMRDNCALAVHGNMLYVNLLLEEDYPRKNYGAIYGIDLAREGFVVFGLRTFAEEVGEELRGWSFAGPPAVVADHLLIPGMRFKDNDTECRLFRFQREGGQWSGHVFLGRGGPVSRYGDRFSSDLTRRLITPSPIAVRNGVAYVCSNVGVVAAIRAADLKLQWLFRYNRLLPTDSARYTREVFYLTGGWPTRSPVVYADRLLVSPADSRYLYELARWPNAEGDLVLNEPVEKETRLAWIGATSQELYFLVKRGREQSIQATDHSGSILWETPPLPAEEPVIGVPAQTKRHLYIPTDTRIYRLDLARQGFVDDVIVPPPKVGVPFPEVGVFGDLLATPGFLVSQSSQFLLLFEPSGRSE